MADTGNEKLITLAVDTRPHWDENWAGTILKAGGERLAVNNLARAQEVIQTSDKIGAIIIGVLDQPYQPYILVEEARARGIPVMVSSLYRGHPLIVDDGSHIHWFVQPDFHNEAAIAAVVAAAIGRHGERAAK